DISDARKDGFVEVIQPRPAGAAEVPLCAAIAVPSNGLALGYGELVLGHGQPRHCGRAGGPAAILAVTQRMTSRIVRFGLITHRAAAASTCQHRISSLGLTRT